MGFLMPLDGYGYGTIKIAEALRRLFCQWQVLDMRTPAGTFDPQDGRSWWIAGRAVALCTPDWLPQIDAEDGLIAYTMFEATKLPAGWAEKINRHAEQVIVPCRWNAEVFRENGVTVPISVAKWGVDGADYPVMPRLQIADGRLQVDGAGRPRPYTFLWSGTPDRRKGYDLAYRAFFRAFGEREDVQLVMHFRRRPIGLQGCRERNVRIVEGLFDRPVLRAMLQRADAFVFPSRGEGWGAPPREAAATGLPVIATDWSGLAEDINEWALPLRVHGMSKAEYGWDEWEDIGEWAEPDEDHLIELLRWCAAHPEAAAERGMRAAAWLRANATWEQTARAIDAIAN
jgi:glycosyltransferase involved in cell wall biosynthesis